jgi:hypothetical protein
MAADAGYYEIGAFGFDRNAKRSQTRKRGGAVSTAGKVLD